MDPASYDGARVQENLKRAVAESWRRVWQAVGHDRPRIIDAVDSALLLTPRGERLDHIATLSAHVPSEDLNRLLANWWSDTEFPSGYGVRNIVALFRQAGFVTDREGGPPPRAPLTVAVLGIFHGRGEAEVVVDPRRLRRVRIVGTEFRPDGENQP